MSTVDEIERAIENLSEADRRSLLERFAERDAAEWDRQLEADVQAGKLDTLADEALRDLREGRCIDL